MNDFLPFDRILSNPVTCIRRAGLRVFLGLLLGVFLPGALSYAFGTLFSDDVTSKLPTAIQRRIIDFNRNTDLLQGAIANLDRQIPQTASNQQETSVLLQYRNSLSSYLETRTAPFHVAAFYLDPLMFVYPAFYVSFFWLIFIFAPNVRTRISWFSYASLFVCLLVLVRWPTWLRNVELFRDFHRKVYADTNVDISAGAFLMQEGNAALGTWCVLQLMIIWLFYFCDWRSQIAPLRQITFMNVKQASGLVRALARQFIHWQVSSFLLAVAFFPYTYFFWRYVIDFGDLRYLMHAIVIHALWGACWLIISLPLAQTWYEWNLKQVISSFKTDESGISGGDERIIGLPESPIGLLNGLTSLILAALTFASPAIKAIAGTH